MISQSILAYEYYHTTDEIFNYGGTTIKNPGVVPDKGWMERNFNNETKKVLTIADHLSKGFILFLKGVNEYYIPNE